MSAALINSPPAGEFAYVSALTTNWHSELHLLIRLKRPVHYDCFPLRKFPQDVLEQVYQHDYQHLILANDRWQHFFIPPASDFKHPAYGEPKSEGEVHEGPPPATTRGRQERYGQPTRFGHGTGTVDGTQGCKRYPAFYGDSVVFTAEGDLWRVPVDGDAHRLTTHPSP